MLVAFAGCAASIYGVTEEQWIKMTDSERQSAIDAYNERERLLKIKQEEKAAMEAQNEAIRRERVNAIYRGESGQYGDLIRVSIWSGKMKIAGRHRDYHPLSFKIADGETKRIRVIHEEGKYGTYDDLHVSYHDSVLYIDTSEDDVRYATRIIYDIGWKIGKQYFAVDTAGRLRLRNAQVQIEIIPHLTHYQSSTGLPVGE